MPKDATGDRLGNKRHITLVLRLVVDTVDTLMHGEIGDLNGRMWRRFAAWDKLAGSVHAVLTEREGED